jgi:hypothetical protein
MEHRRWIKVGLELVLVAAVSALAAQFGQWPLVATILVCVVGLLWAHGVLARVQQRIQKGPSPSPSALPQTTKGIADLFVQEFQAHEARIAARDLLLHTITRLGEHAGKYDAELKAFIAREQKAKRQRPIETATAYRDLYSSFAHELVALVPELREQTTQFTDATNQLMECWSGYVRDATAPRHGVRPDYENRRQTLHGYANDDAFQLTISLRDEFIAALQTKSEQLDLVVNEIVAEFDRVVATQRALRAGAMEFLARLDHWRRPRRFRRLWRSRDARA